MYVIETNLQYSLLLRREEKRALTRFMLLVGDPLKDSGISEDWEKKKKVRFPPT